MDKRERTTIEKIFLVLLLILLAFALFSLARDFFSFSRQGFLSPNERHMDEDRVRDWMTFSYVNRAFDLPSEYLREELDITAKNYPNLTIRSWAGQKNESSQWMLERVKELIRQYRNEGPFLHSI